MSSLAEIADPILDVVERTWGFTSFCRCSGQAIDAVLAGQDSLLVVPTGEGSRCVFRRRRCCSTG